MRKLVMRLLLVTVLSAGSAAQESIRVDVNRVTVAFSARDADGRLVDDLSKDDFEVVEESFANFR